MQMHDQGMLLDQLHTVFQVIIPMPSQFGCHFLQ